MTDPVYGSRGILYNNWLTRNVLEEQNTRLERENVELRAKIARLEYKLSEQTSEVTRLLTQSQTHVELRDTYRDEIRRYQRTNRDLQWRLHDLERDNRTLRRYAALERDSRL